jgi:hypothetical protein
LIFSSLPAYLCTRRKVLIFVMGILILSSTSRYKHLFKFMLFDYNRDCLVKDDKRELSKELYKIAGSIPLDKRILATAGVVPQILRPKQLLYQPIDYLRILDYYDYLILEKDSNGETWPLIAEEIASIINKCRPHASEILLDNKYFIIMKGHFTEACIEQVKHRGATGNLNPYVYKG